MTRLCRRIIVASTKPDGVVYCPMNADLKFLFERAVHWPQEDQEELAQVAIEIEARQRGVYHATTDELKAIDEALAAVARAKWLAMRMSKRSLPNTAVHESQIFFVEVDLC